MSKFFSKLNLFIELAKIALEMAVAVVLIYKQNQSRFSNGGLFTN